MTLQILSSDPFFLTTRLALLYAIRPAFPNFAVFSASVFLFSVRGLLETCYIFVRSLDKFWKMIYIKCWNKKANSGGGREGKANEG
jgi:hypothetical protein